MTLVTAPEVAFVDALSDVINRYSRENASNTPDFILGQYLMACLAAWDVGGGQQRETWYRRDARPTMVTGETPTPYPLVPFQSW